MWLIRKNNVSLYAINFIVWIKLLDMGQDVTFPSYARCSIWGACVVIINFLLYFIFHIIYIVCICVNMKYSAVLSLCDFGFNLLELYCVLFLSCLIDMCTA